MERTLLRTIHTHRLFDGLAGTPLVVGVSGGPDSLALLHWLREHAARWGITLHVAHLDHGFRGEAAAADAAWVAATCAAWGIPSTIRAAAVPAWAAAQRRSPEDAARQVRYAFLWGVAAAVGARAVAVAHNADDQAETVLLRLLRGTGPRGLAGMRPRRALTRPPATESLLAEWGLPVGDQPIALVRPLLATRRQAIEAYCAAHGLAPRQDLTNRDFTYTRNRIRHEVIPVLEQIQPGVRRRLWRLAAQMARQNDAGDRRLDTLWPQLCQAGRLDLALFAQLTPEDQAQALVRFYREGAENAAGLTRAHIRAARRLARPDGAPGRWVPWPGGVAVVREYGTLVRVAFDPRTGAFDLAADAARYPLLPVPGEYPLGSTNPHPGLGPWRLRVDLTGIEQMRDPLGQVPPPDAWTAYFDGDALGAGGGSDRWPVVLRTRRPGERMHPLGLSGRSRRLQDVLTDAQIPRRLRNHLALLALPGGEVLWVPGPGGRQSDHAKITPATQRVLVARFVRE